MPFWAYKEVTLLHLPLHEDDLIKGLKLAISSEQSLHILQMKKIDHDT